MGISPGQIEIKKTTKFAKSHFIRRAADTFLNSSSRFLKKGDTSKCERAFEDIISQAVDLSFSLWTQRSYLTKEGKRLLGEEFKRDHKTWVPSGLHTADLSDDEHCMDGLPVLMVFHPAVIAYGDSEGTDYSRTRILKQAVVWMRGKNE
jgi:hypothetical protein